MNEDRINALLVFVGGLLVFAAATAPIIRLIFAKVTTDPAKAKAKLILQPVLSLLFIVTALIFFLSGREFSAVLIFFINAVFSSLCFYCSKREITRASIMSDAIFPIALALMVGFFAYWKFNSDRIDKLEAEQGATGQAPTALSAP